MSATRRTVAAGMAASAAASSLSAFAQDDQIAHVLPTASDREFLIKASLRTAQREDVSLIVNGTRVAGERTDSEGRYWRFRARGLKPGAPHRLEIAHRRRALGPDWTLSTLPARDADISRFRILSFTCAGGYENARSINDIEAFRPLALRRRLIARGLSFQPDAVIAIGDHIYWDQRAWLEHPNAEIRRLTRAAYDQFGYLDRSALMFGGANEAILKRIGETQIAQLYGRMLQGVPCFFVNDDHDYFENDDATQDFVTFPPDDFQVRGARALQRMFYPEFLPDTGRPEGLSGASAADNGPGVSECFGTLRAGRLFEAALTDCGRFLSLKGEHAGLIPEDAEAWLIARAKAEDTRHFMHVPSHPMGWTAGKWREWYPDVVAAAGSGEVVVSTHNASGARGRLTTERAKFMWQPGWRAQHQRIVAALSGQRTRAAAALSGDLHAVGSGALMRSGTLDLRANPLRSILAGPISSSGAGWPSFARGTPAQAPEMVTLEAAEAPREQNGFTLIDVEPDRMRVRQFAWREPTPEAAIDTLEPFATFDIERPA